MYCACSFFSSPAKDDKEDLKLIRKKFKDSAVDVVNFGEEDEERNMLDACYAYVGFIAALCRYHAMSKIKVEQNVRSTVALMYAMTCKRPNASFVVGKLSSSTIESEFVALAATGKEVEWLKNLLLEIPLWVKPIALISIRYDSAATLAKAYSHMYNGKSRHLGVRHSMIHERITNGVVSLEFVRSQQNLDDHLTKGLARDLVIKSAERMGLKIVISLMASALDSPEEKAERYHQGVIHQRKYPQRVKSLVSLFSIEPLAYILFSELAECSGC
ncbi:hypothetical protein Tco_1491140 [Tanacetum coccineum]